MIIKDFTDNDLYKFTTMNAIQKKFPDAEVVYRFVNRGETDFPSGFAEALQAEVEEMRGLTLTDEAERFMRRKCYYFDSVFFDLLKGYRFDPSEVRILWIMVSSGTLGGPFNGDDIGTLLSDARPVCPAGGRKSDP